MKRYVQRFWQVRNRDWWLRNVSLYAGYTGALGAIGEHYYGIVWGRFRSPLLAVYVDDSFYDPALAFGVAVWRFRAGAFMTLRYRGKSGKVVG